MKTTVTLYRYYSRKQVIEVDIDAIEGLTKEEIADKLHKEEIVIPEFDEDVADLVSMEVTPRDEQEDRFDIYNDKGEHIYGGHL